MLKFKFYIISSVLLAALFVILFVLRGNFVNIDSAAWIYMLTSSVSHAAMLMLIPFVLGWLMELPFGKGNMAGYNTMTFLTAFLFVLVIADGMTFDLYRFHINGFVMGMLFSSDAGNIFHFGAGFVLGSIARIIAIFAFFFTLAWIIRRWGSNVGISRSKCVVLLVLVTLVAQGMNIYAAAVRHQGMITCSENLPHYYPLSANRKLAKWGLIDPNDQHNLKLSGGTLCYPLEELQWNSISPDSATNIVWLMIDSWNSRAFDAETTPNIARLAAHSHVYSRHRSCSNGTISSVFGIFSGISDYYRTDFELSHASPVMMERLANLNYDIRFYPSASLNNPPIARTLFSQFPNLRCNTVENDSYRSDCTLTDDFVAYLDSAKSSGKPFFAWCFYDLPHAIYQPKGIAKRFTPAWDYADYTALNNNTDPTEFWNCYRNCVFLVDSLIGRIAGKLSECSLDKRTVIVVTGDHSQEFNENKKNFWGHNGNFSPAQTQVPMIIASPDVTVGDTLSHRTTHYDVAYTMLTDVLGLKNAPENICMGRNMNDTTDRGLFICGSRQNFALVSDSMIIEKRPSGNLQITDNNLNPIDESNVDYSLISETLMHINRFYK